MASGGDNEAARRPTIQPSRGAGPPGPEKDANTRRGESGPDGVAVATLGRTRARPPGMFLEVAEEIPPPARPARTPPTGATLALDRDLTSASIPPAPRGRRPPSRPQGACGPDFRGTGRPSSRARADASGGPTQGRSARRTSGGGQISCRARMAGTGLVRWPVIGMQDFRGPAIAVDRHPRAASDRLQLLLQVVFAASAPRFAELLPLHGLFRFHGNTPLCLRSVPPLFSFSCLGSGC